MHSALKLIHNFVNRKSPFIAFDAHDIAFSFDFSGNRYTIQYTRVCFLYIALSKVFTEKKKKKNNHVAIVKRISETFQQSIFNLIHNIINNKMLSSPLPSTPENIDK